jgi:hypothetical protein
MQYDKFTAEIGSMEMQSGVFTGIILLLVTNLENRCRPRFHDFETTGKRWTVRLTFGTKQEHMSAHREEEPREPV